MSLVMNGHVVATVMCGMSFIVYKSGVWWIS